MRPSMDSEKAMLKDTSNRQSLRVSTYSKAPSDAPSDQSRGSMPSGDPRAAEIKGYTKSYKRLDDKRLQEQRYPMSPEKERDMSNLAFLGKVEKALDRRYTSQDATMKPKKVMSEKRS